MRPSVRLVQDEKRRSGDNVLPPLSALTVVVHDLIERSSVVELEAHVERHPPAQRRQPPQQPVSSPVGRDHPHLRIVGRGLDSSDLAFGPIAQKPRGWKRECNDERQRE